MSKHQPVRRTTAGERSPTDAMRDTLTALIREAHHQRNDVAKDVQTPLFESRTAIGGRLTEERSGTKGSGQTAWVSASGGSRISPMLPDNLQPLLRESEPRRRLADLVLQKVTRDEIREFVEEAGQATLLRAHSLEPRHTVLLIGPPGTGKTSLAGAIATELALPFLTVRYDGLVGSFLGETASRLQEIIDYASRTPCVLFFDEFDSVGKERSDAHETGEIKRVVSSLLLLMDGLPSSCIVVCATNHPELLDRAVWRRFEVRVNLPRPGAVELKDWFGRVQKAYGSLGMSSQEFVARFNGETFSEIEAITLDARRKVVLSHGAVVFANAFKEAAARWERRRELVGGLQDGARADRPNKPRAGPTRSSAGPKATSTKGASV